MINDKIYDRKIVEKPWGNEYVVFRNKNKLAITLLKINYRNRTSLHCHPKKKTGFILLDGKAKIQLGLWKQNSKTYYSPSKLMIRTGLFHSIEAVSKKGVKALEFEVPVKKNDLVRFDDNYGRSMKPYEGKDHIKKISKENIIFIKPKKGIEQNYKVGNTKIKLKVYESFKNIINKKNSTIFAVIDGSVVDKKNRNILSIGDIIQTGTFKKLATRFKIKKKLVLLSVE